MEPEIHLIYEKTVKFKKKLGDLVTSYEYPTDPKSQILHAYHSIMAEHHDRREALSEIVGQTLSRDIAEWLALIESAELEKQQEAYEKIIQRAMNLIQRGNRMNRSEEMCREIIINVDLMLSDPEARNKLLSDVLAETAKLISSHEETVNLVDAIQDEVILKLKRPL